MLCPCLLALPTPPVLHPLSELGAGGRCQTALCVRVWQGLLVATGRNVQIVRPLEDVEVMEKEGATFSCEVSHDEVPAHWFREGVKLRPTDNVRIRQEGEMDFRRTSPPSHSQATSPFTAKWSLFPGRTYTLIYRRVLVGDAGEIKFVAENAESRAQLRVKGNGSLGQGMGWTMCVCEQAHILGLIGPKGQLSLFWGPSRETQQEGKGAFPLRQEESGLREVGLGSPSLFKMEVPVNSSSCDCGKG